MNKKISSHSSSHSQKTVQALLLKLMPLLVLFIFGLSQIHARSIKTTTKSLVFIGEDMYYSKPAILSEVNVREISGKIKIGTGFLKTGPANIKNLQQSVVTGIVTDANGNLLPGASIIEKGTNNGTQSDFDGNYSIELNDQNSILVVSYIGFASIEVPVNGRNNIDITLEESTSSLDEVVVVGYGTQRKVDLTGAVAVVDVEAAKRLPVSQVSEQLQGLAAGVTVNTSGRPGETPQIRIRGLNTFGSGNPLYIVDGIPTQDIRNINPNDVANIQVLKDAGAASIYGARAANGVIIISTKKGSGKLTVTYNGYAGYQNPPSGNVYEILSPQEQAQLEFQVSRTSNPGVPINDLQYGSGESPVIPFYILPGGASQGEVDESAYFVNTFYSDPAEIPTFNQIIRANPQGTNWFEEIFSPAVMQSHDISIGQGTENGNYLFSLNYFDQEGTMLNTFLERYTLRFNSQFDISEKLRIGQNITYSIEDTNTDTQTDPILMSYRVKSIVPVFDIAGNFAGTRAPGMGFGLNPVAALTRNADNVSRTNRIFGNIYAEYDILDELTFRSNFGGSFFGLKSSAFRLPEYENAANQVTAPELIEAALTGYDWTWSNTLQYQKKFKDRYDVKLLLGTEAFRNVDEGLQASGQGFFSPDRDFVSLSTASGTQANSGFFNDDGLFSVFSRLDFVYDDKYLLGATIRRDATSRFTNPREGWFPAVSLGWRISQESFMDDIDWISELKIRGGYGVLGNQLNVDPANAFTTFSSNRATSFFDVSGSNNTIVEGFEKARVGNPDAQWERNENSNIGIDAILFDSKLQITADYYRKDVVDLLFNPELPATAGSAEVPFINIAEMKNSGLDLSVKTLINFSENFRMNATLNFTTYKNEIVEISDGAENFDINAGGVIVRNETGGAVGRFFGYNIEGFWNSQAEIDAADAQAQASTGNSNAIFQTAAGLGRFRYTDVDNDNIITPEDRTFIGDPNPDFTAGLNLGFEYKNFDLNAFLYSSYGNDIVNNIRRRTDFAGTFPEAKSKTALYDSWTPENTNARAPIQENASNFSTAGAPNSYFVEDGSYLRLRSLQLGYNFPTSVTDKLGMQALRMYLQGTNLFTITGYTGVDPEITGSPTSFGIDGSAYPFSSNMLLGINFTF